jgi:hypothetical protein
MSKPGSTRSRYQRAMCERLLNELTLPGSAAIVIASVEAAGDEPGGVRTSNIGCPHHPVLELITRVLEEADRPMRPYEVHAAASKLYERPLLRHSVKEALSAYTIGADRRFRRVGYGRYELAR